MLPSCHAANMSQWLEVKSSLKTLETHLLNIIANVTSGFFNSFNVSGRTKGSYKHHRSRRPTTHRKISSKQSENELEEEPKSQGRFEISSRKTCMKRVQYALRNATSTINHIHMVAPFLRCYTPSATLPIM